MSSHKKSVYRRIAMLEKSGRTLVDVFNVLFENEELVLGEISSATRRMSVTYGQAKRDAAAVARAIADFGITDRYIGLWGENSVRWICAFWGIVLSGNKPYLVNLRQPQSYSDNILGTLDAFFVLDCDGKCVTRHAKSDYSDLLEQGRAIPEEAELPPGADCFAISTNGTTLREKICFYSGREICEQLLNIKAMLREGPDLIRPYRGRIKSLAFLPMYHVFGFEAMYLWYSLFGATFVFLSDRNPETILRAVRRHRVTHIFAVPLLWHSVEKKVRQRLAAQEESARKKFNGTTSLVLRLWNVSPRLGELAAKKLLSTVRSQLFGDSVRFCISGGSFITPSALELVNSLGYPLYNGYGSTEAGITSVELSKKASKRLLGSIGKPFSSVEYSRDESGQLLIRGSSLCREMLVDGRPAQAGQWFATGDVVRLDKSGRAFVDGRASDVVLGHDGENLNPDLAEKAFSLASAQNWCVMGDASNSNLVLVVQISPELSRAQRQQLLEEIETCKSTLPASYGIRETVFTTDSIMAPGAIKVSRAHLRREMDAGRVGLVELFAEEGTCRAEAETEESSIRVALREMFADILGLEESEISPSANFMTELGGSSLDYFTLLGEINNRFGVALDFETDRFGYTLNDFERVISQRVH